MQTYVILLRGVMPTGKNRTPMAQLREVLTNNGFTNVRTWIQSGNIVLQTNLSAKELEKRVHSLIKEHIGPDLVIIARTNPQLKTLINGNPFGKEYDISRVFFVSFAQSPPKEKVEELLAQDFSPEELVIMKQSAYMYIPGTYGKGKLSNNFLEAKLKVSATTRNFNTISKMIELSEENSNN